MTELPFPLPPLSWIRGRLRDAGLRRMQVLEAYVVGSYARGTAHPLSDLDIAVVIPYYKNATALARTERYHSRFTSDEQKPHWQGIRVDFQFFYPQDPHLSRYATIRLSEVVGQH